MRIKRLVGLLSIGGLAFAAFMPAAQAAGVAFDVTSPTKAYAIFDPTATYGTVGIGGTNPGFPDSETCFKMVLDDGTFPVAHPPAPWFSNTNSGPVLNGGGTVVYVNTDQNFVPVAACTINLTPIQTVGKAVDAVGVASFTGVAQNVSVDRGITASASTAYMVTHPAGTVVAATGDATLSFGITPAGPTASIVVVTSSVPVLSKSKIDVAVPAATCELQESDVTPAAGTWAGTGTFTGTYRICAQLAGQNVVKGKKFNVTATGGTAGPVTLNLVQGNTVGPQLWDQTLGKCKVDTDDPLAIPPAPTQPARALVCKGAFGDPLPLTIAVRVGSPVTGGGIYGNPAGLADAQGITTPLPQLLATAQIL